MRHTLTTLTTVVVASASYAQSLPEPNPVAQADGTFIWYAGNNTQYPIIQAAINAAGSGDEIVIRGGTYTESLNINKSGITIRPFVTDFISGSGGAYVQTFTYEPVTFVNPISGSSSSYALKMTGSNGTYIGRPRQFTELSNGLDVETEIVVRNPMDYSIQMALDTTSGNYTTSQVSPQKVSSLNNSTAVRDVFTFQSRSLDDVAIWSDGGQGTFNGCTLESDNGFGGGLMITGANNTTSFVNCDVQNFFATGNTHSEALQPVCVINITGDSTNKPTFQNCNVNSSDASAYGAVYQKGADVSWYHCTFSGNDAQSADGTYMLENGSMDMFLCDFTSNNSGQGTVYMDLASGANSHSATFTRCDFTSNNTVSGNEGGVLKVNHPSGGTTLAPQVMMSDCRFSSNNGLDFPNPQNPSPSAFEAVGDMAIVTPYSPEYRIGLDNGSGYSTPATAPETNPVGGDVNGDGNMDSFDVIDLFDMLGMCREDLDDSGSIDFNDLLNVLVNFGNTCE